MEYNFKKHALNDAELLWMQAAERIGTSDKRVIKVELLGKIPLEFDPTTIDIRLWRADEPTLVGLWHLNTVPAIFSDIDRGIRAIREEIIQKRAIDDITAEELGKRTELPKLHAGRVLHQLTRLKGFSGGSNRMNDSPRRYVESLSLRGDNSYNGYLDYQSIWDVIEQDYEDWTPIAKENQARRVFYEAGVEAKQVETAGSTNKHGVKINTAFVLMAIDANNSAIEDVYEAIKEVCREFEIVAIRADKIEHSGKITEVVLGEIRMSEFLIADLSYERPNVYYEIGYAHALGKEPIMYRKSGTRLHFDLAVHNAPEYKNVTDLRAKLRERLKALRRG